MAPLRSGSATIGTSWTTPSPESDLRQLEPGLRARTTHLRRLDDAAARGSAGAQPQLEEPGVGSAARPHQRGEPLDGVEALGDGRLLTAPHVLLDGQLLLDLLDDEPEVLAEVDHRLLVVLLRVAPALEGSAGQHHRRHEDEDQRERAVRDGEHHQPEQRRDEGGDQRQSLGSLAFRQLRHTELATFVDRRDPRRPGEVDLALQGGHDPGRLPADLDLEHRLAELEPVAGAQGGAVDPVAVEEHAVGRAQVDDLHDVGDEQLGVPARDRGVLHPHLAPAATTDVGRARTEGERPALVRPGHDGDAGDRGATVGIPLGAPGDGQVSPRPQPALGDGGVRVHGDVAGLDVCEGELAEALLHGGSRARRIGEHEVLGHLAHGGGAVDGGDEVGVDVTGRAQGELQLHEGAVLRVRAARVGSLRERALGVTGPRANSGRGSTSERSRRQKSQLARRSPRALLVDFQ